MESIQTIALWALAGGVLNRFSGWTDYLPGRNIYYAALAALGLVWFFYGWLWATLVFVSFLAYRLPGWYTSLDMGTYADSVERDVVVMYLRGLFFVPVFAYATYAGNFYALGFLAAASAGATVCYLIGNWPLSKYMKDPFWFIEFGAGACFGAALALTVG